MEWKRNLPVRKRGLVAEAGGIRIWIHRRDEGKVVYRLAYRLPGGEIEDYNYGFARLKYAKEFAERVVSQLGRETA